MSANPTRPLARRLATLLVAVLVVGIVVWSGASDHPAAAAEPVVVTRADESAPDGCGPREVALRLREFYAAFNRGDRKALRGFFEAEPAFQWFSFTLGGKKAVLRRHFVAQEHKPLHRYFAARHRENEHFRLVEAGSSYDGERGVVSFSLRTEVRADDLKARGVKNKNAVGKGAMSCASRRFIVTSMSLPALRRSVSTGALCPAPADPPRPSQSVACGPPPG